MDRAGAATMRGRHEKPFRPGGWAMVTVPPVLDVDNGSPVPSAAVPPVTWTDDDELVVVGETLNETLATTPLEIAVTFWPHTTQVVEPGTLLQDNDLLPPETTGPATIVAAEKSAGE